jgi:acyl-CoA synthetase (AMP-forming)/AMP-acid ligase II
MNKFETLQEVSRWNSEQRPDDVAFIVENRKVSFFEFELRSNQLAHKLIEEGLRPQSRVSMIAKDSEFGYQLVFGCAKSGIVLVGINWRLTVQEISYILENSESEILFVGEEFFSIAEQVLPLVPRIRKVVVLKGMHPQWPSFQTWYEGQSESSLNITVASTDPVVQMYTSGTTGHPKGVQLAHYSFFRLLQGMKEQGDVWMDLKSEDRLLITVPMFHIGGLWWGIQSFIAGATGVILEAFVAWKVLEVIPQHKISKIAMVPAMIQFCLSEPGCATTDFSSLKAILYGGSPMTPALLRNALQTFRCDFYQIYGMTETGNMAVCLRPEDHTLDGTKKRNVAGKPLPGVQAKVIDSNGNELPTGQTGEICLRSPARMVGYWKNEKATTETLVDGWIHTGDGGYIDEDGYVFVSDRIKDMIICAGENIFPAEIEAVIADHPAVAEVAVIGVPDDLWGEAVKAFVVLRSDQTIKQRELINFIRSRIADFKTPKSISFVESLPRNSSGKVLKRTLRAPFWEGRERMVN